MAALIMAGGAATTGGKVNGNANGQVADAASRVTGSLQSAGKFKISAAGDGMIHIDMAGSKASDASIANSLKKIRALVNGTIPAQAAQRAGTTITLKDASTLTEGNAIIIDGTTYTITKKGTGANELKMGDDILEQLQKKLGDAIASISTDGKVLKIYTANVDPDAEAPVATGKGLTLQIGDTVETWNQLNVVVRDCHAVSLGVEGLDISTQEAAQAAIDKIKDSINYVSDVRGTLGATQNRLDHTINNLSVMTENIQDAESTIRDTDIAEEMMAYTKNNILIQSAQAMLAQANQVPQGVLQLLQ